MRYVCKNPPGGGERNPYQLIDYFFLEMKILHCPGWSYTHEVLPETFLLFQSLSTSKYRIY